MDMLKGKLSGNAPASNANYSAIPSQNNSSANFGSKATNDQKVWGPGAAEKQEDVSLIALDDQTTEDQPVALLPFDLDDAPVEINLMEPAGKTKELDQIDSTSKDHTLKSFMSNFTSSSPASAIPQQMDEKLHRMADPALSTDAETVKAVSLELNAIMGEDQELEGAFMSVNENL